MKKSIFSILVLTFCAGCLHYSHKGPVHLQAGMWRGVLHRADGINVPFNFEVKDTAYKSIIYIVNGAERLLVDSLRYAGDSVYIHMPFFDADFQTRSQNDGSLQGEFVKHYPDSNRVLKFTATPHTNYRIIPSPASAKYNVSGRWKTTFIRQRTGKKETTNAVGEFHQQGNRLTGTFLTKSGDYRYLQGVMDGDTLKLSAFDGSHIFLFKAKVKDDSTLTDGVFYSGFADKDSWTAKKDSNAHLPDPFTLTTFRPDENKLDFAYPDLNGDTISLSDNRFKNKVIIVQIMGSWCPNCMDETQFLSDWYKKNKSRGVDIIGLCYERSTVFHEAVKSVMTFKDRFDVTYPLLITGITPGDPQLLQKTLPQLQHFAGFPTTIFINKEGNIAKIDAGFSGPGTGEHYREFMEKFNRLVDRLVAE